MTMDKKQMAESWVLCSFSPTGTTLAVARALGEGSGCRTRELDLTRADFAPQLGEEELLLVAVPVYAGRVPQLAVGRLGRLQGAGQQAVAVVVYGNRAYDDALLELQRTLEGRGFEVVAAAAFIAEHSIAREIGAGRPDAEDLQLAHSFARAVVAKQAAGKKQAPQVPGQEPYVEPKQAPFHPLADDRCSGCGLCAAACPAGAIPVEQPQQTLGDKCINCMRCVKLCPVGARALPQPFREAVSKMLAQTAAGYKKPEFFL